MEKLLTASNISVSENCSSLPSSYKKVAIVSAVSGIVSMIACTIILFLFVLFKKWIFFTQRLIFYLILASLCNAFSQILHPFSYIKDSGTQFCVFGGFLEQVTSWMILNSVFSITTYLFAIAVFSRNTKRLELLYLSAIFVLPILIGLFPFIKSSYGPSGAWCWIKVQDPVTCQTFPPGQAFMTVLWFLPFYILAIAMILMYAGIIVSLYRHKCRKNWASETTAETKHLNEESRKKIVSLIAYPIIYFILMQFSMMNRLENKVHPNNPSIVFWYLSAICSPIAGGLLAVAYTLDKETRKRMTWPHIHSAIREWTTRSGPQEYPVANVQEEENNDERKTLLSIPDPVE